MCKKRIVATGETRGYPYLVSKEKNCRYRRNTWISQSGVQEKNCHYTHNSWISLSGVQEKNCHYRQNSWIFLSGVQEKNCHYRQNSWISLSGVQEKNCHYRQNSWIFISGVQVKKSRHLFKNGRYVHTILFDIPRHFEIPVFEISGDICNCLLCLDIDLNEKKYFKYSTVDLQWLKTKFANMSYLSNRNISIPQI